MKLFKNVLALVGLSAVTGALTAVELYRLAKRAFTKENIDRITSPEAFSKVPDAELENFIVKSHEIAEKIIPAVKDFVHEKKSEVSDVFCRMVAAAEAEQRRRAELEDMPEDLVEPTVQPEQNMPPENTKTETAKDSKEEAQEE